MSRRRRASAHGRGGADCAVGSTARQSTVQGGIIVSCTTVHVVQSASGRAGQLSVQLKILLYERPLCWLGFLGFSFLVCRAVLSVECLMCFACRCRTKRRRGAHDTRHDTHHSPRSPSGAGGAAAAAAAVTSQDGRRPGILTARDERTIHKRACRSAIQRHPLQPLHAFNSCPRRLAWAYLARSRVLSAPRLNTTGREATSARPSRLS